MKKSIQACLLGLSFSLSGITFAKECKYQLERKHVKMEWTGFKFTEKAGVKGSFDAIEYKFDKSQNLEKMLESVSFAIETASLNSNDPYRDKKLVMFIFGALKNPGVISGKVDQIDLKKNTASLKLNLNGVEKNIPFKVSKNGKELTFSGKFRFSEFNMTEAFEAIHKACEALHTGADGISKTWDEVDLKVITTPHCH